MVANAQGFADTDKGELLWRPRSAKVIRWFSIILMACALTACLTPVDAAPPFTKGDWQYQLTWTAVHVVDAAQTMEIAKNPDQYEEHNVLLGKHPSEGAVVGFMVFGAIAHWGIARYALEGKQRRRFQRLTIGFSSANAVNNYRIGIRF